MPVVHQKKLVRKVRALPETTSIKPLNTDDNTRRTLITKIRGRFGLVIPSKPKQKPGHGRRVLPIKRYNVVLPVKQLFKTIESFRATERVLPVKPRAQKTSVKPVEHEVTTGPLLKTTAGDGATVKRLALPGVMA